MDLKRPEDALASYDKAIALKPDLAELEGLRLHTKMHLCDWSNFDAEYAHLILSVRNGNVNTHLSYFWAFLHLPTTSSDARNCGSRINILLLKSRSGRASGTITIEFALLIYPPIFTYTQRRFWIAELFEWHDRSRFEVIGVSFGLMKPQRDKTAARWRLLTQFHDVQWNSDERLPNSYTIVRGRYRGRPDGIYGGFAIGHFRSSSCADPGELSRLSWHNGGAIHRLHHR